MDNDSPVAFEELVESLDMLSVEWRVTLVIFGLVATTALVAFIASRIILHLEKRFQKTSNLWDDAILHALRKPVVAMVWLQGVFWAAELAHRYSGAEIFGLNKQLLQVGVVWLIAWTLTRFIRESEAILVSPLKMRKPMDYTTVTAISKLGRAVVIITAVLVVLQTMGFSVSGVLAFGGIGGIAVGFAARDLLANFFGGLTVYMDKPFKVGDWIRSPDRNIEGTVENIGWRLTTIRTFDQRPLYVPNAVFTTISVENPSRMHNRRIFETIGIRYVDVKQMPVIVDEIRQMLVDHEEIETELRTLIVNFTTFNASSLDIMVYTFTKTTQWARFHEIKQDVLLKISDIIESHGAEVAFPTRTLHIAQDKPDDQELSAAELSQLTAPSQPRSETVK